MQRRIMTRPKLAWSVTVAVLVSLLVLGGCGTSQVGSRTSTHATMTVPLIPATQPPSPPVPTLHLLPIKARLAIPGSLGLLLYPAVATSMAGLPSLAFYSYSTQQVTTIATAPTEPNGSQGGITNGSYYGTDWVSYVTESDQQTNWVLWSYNLNTGQRVQLDSQAQEGSTVQWGVQSSNATDVVWAILKGTSAGITSTLFDYNYATGQRRTLLANVANILRVQAMSATAVLYAQIDQNGQGATTWILPLDASAPKKLSDDAGVNAWLGSEYAVWDDPHTSSTEVYNLATGMFYPTYASCLRPAVGGSPPYLVCVQWDTDAWLLINLTTAAQTSFDTGKANLGDGGQIYNGRAFLIAPNGDVAYFNLPTS